MIKGEIDMTDSNSSSFLWQLFLDGCDISDKSSISIWKSFLCCGQTFENIIHGCLVIILLFFLILIVIRTIEKRIKIDKINYVTEKLINFIIDNTPSKLLKIYFSKLFDIEASAYILLPKSSIRNYKYLGYQLNGINRFLEHNRYCKEKIKVILVDNSSTTNTHEELKAFTQQLSENRRYIIIATMSDIFDTLLEVVGHQLEDKNYRNKVKIIGTLASQSERYRSYEQYENVIRISPPDFDEARKAASNISSKIISNYCSNNSQNSQNNIILITSNSYGEAVKKSFFRFFSEYQDEFDMRTNIHVKEEEFNRSIFKYSYSFDNEKGITPDSETNYTFKDFLTEKANGAINTIFLIGYEPNISKILENINEQIKEEKLTDSEFSILISATASVKEWKESIIDTSIRLNMIESIIGEINYIKIEYPKFSSNDGYSATKICFELNKIDIREKRLYEIEFESEVNWKEIEKTISEPTMNYISGFIYMSLEFVHQINDDWEVNLLSLKEKLFHNQDRNYKDIVGVKILSNGDSINHFKVRKLEV